MRRGPVGSLAASPTLVGAVTVLVVIVAVFLSYQANQGLPFVPTYRVSAELPNANSLVPGNEVRIGGIRVGQIQTIEPVQREDGSVAAKVDMELQEDLDPLPVDSTLIVRSRSALGLKYLEIQRGESDQGFDQGATIPATSARPEPVEIDEVFNTFDDPTRAAIQATLTEFGTALAGRGQNLNAAIGELRPLVERLDPVMRNLGSPETDLAGFVRGLANAAAEAAPVAEIQGRLFVSLERTFGALAEVSRPHIQDFIEKAPETEAVTIAALPKVRPFLANTTVLFRELQPGFEAIRPPSSRQFSQAVGLGVKAQRLAPALNRQLGPTAQSLLTLSRDASAVRGLEDLTEFNNVLADPLSFIAPAQSVCNYATLLFRNVSDATAFGDSLGTNQRFIPLGPPTGGSNEGSPSAGPAAGAGGDSGNFLHYNPYPNTAAPGQERECEAGNEIYQPGQVVVGNVPGNQGIETEAQIPAQLGPKKPTKPKKPKKKNEKPKKGEK